MMPFQTIIGQKARVALARSVYSRAKTLLLDDVLAAVDVSCAQHIIKQCFQSKLMENRRVVLVSHQVQLCSKFANSIVQIGNEGLVSTEKIEQSQHFGAKDKDGKQLAVAASPAAFGFNTASFNPLPVRATEQHKLYQDERSANSSTTSVSHYLWLFRTAGPWWYMFSLVMTYILGGIATIFEGLLLEKWTSQPDQNNTIMIQYIIIASFKMASIAASWLLLFGIGQVGFANSGQVIHDQLLKRITSATFGFFDAVPGGRILNRFAADLYCIDTEIAQSIGWTALAIIQLFASVLLISIKLPILALVVIVMIVPFGFFMVWFSKIRSETRRLHASASSPLMSLYSDLVDNLSTARAFGAQVRV